MQDSERMRHLQLQAVALTNVYVEMQKDYLEIKECMFALIEYLKRQKLFIEDSISKKKKPKKVAKKVKAKKKSIQFV